jgi:hypothetical protein
MAENEDAEARLLRKLEKDDAQPAQIICSDEFQQINKKNKKKIKKQNPTMNKNYERRSKACNPKHVK